MKTLSFANGDTIPMLGLGTWKSEPGEVYEAVLEAIKVGYRHIDCAPIYGNEPEVGQAISEAIEQGIVEREELWITSKLWCNAHKKHQVLPALKQTLSDLGLDYLDLYLVHWPVVLKDEVDFPEKGEDMVSLEKVPVQETWKGMQGCVKEGLASHIGVSNFSAKKIGEIYEYASLKPEMNQVEMHPFLQQQDLVDFCTKQGTYITAYSPLGSMDRPPMLKQENEPILLEHPVITGIADKHDATPAQVLIKWAIQRGTVVIPKSVNPGRIKENFESLQLQLKDDDMAAIKELDRHFRYLDGSIWTSEGSPYTTSDLWDE